METFASAFASLEDWREQRPERRATGFAGLNDATGGFQLGHVWIVTGSPGQGRSVLAAQWAQRLAVEHALSTHLVSARDPATRVAARLTASAARVPLSHLWDAGLSGADEEKIAHRRTTLDAAPIELIGPAEVSIANTEMAEAGIPDALVVDDAHLAGGMFPTRVSAIAARGVLVVLTLPRADVLSSAGIDRAWAAVADFILDIDRPDAVDHASLRPGEADLHLLRNRWGPTRTETVAFQGHYARFVAL